MVVSKKKVRNIDDLFEPRVKRTKPDNFIEQNTPSDEIYVSSTSTPLFIEVNSTVDAANTVVNTTDLNPNTQDTLDLELSSPLMIEENDLMPKEKTEQKSSQTKTIKNDKTGPITDQEVLKSNSHTNNDHNNKISIKDILSCQKKRKTASITNEKDIIEILDDTSQFQGTNVSKSNSENVGSHKKKLITSLLNGNNSTTITASEKQQKKIKIQNAKKKLTSILSGNSAIEFKRYSTVSKDEQMKLPLFPKLQHVGYTSQIFDYNGMNNDYLTFLDKKKGVKECLQKDENFVHNTLPDQYLGNKGSTSSANHEKYPINIKPECFENITSLWCNYFKPENVSDLLIPRKFADHFLDYLEKSFDKLKTTNTRNKLKNNYNNNKTNTTTEFDDFIVPDEFLYEEIKESGCEGSIIDYVPIIIVYGENVGKNALISTCLKDCDIFEINSGINRGKKDITSTVVEASTSYFLNQEQITSNTNTNFGNDLNTFTTNTGKRRGVILFDDVDVLIKENDKFFWNCVEKVLEVSRKPVILTCRDINYIPMNLRYCCELEMGLFEIPKPDDEQLIKYCQSSLNKNNISLPIEVITYLNKKYHSDIRKIFMELQFICMGKQFTIQEQPENLRERNDEGLISLQDYSEFHNNLSLTDVLSKNVENKSNLRKATELIQLSNGQDHCKINPDTLICYMKRYTDYNNMNALEEYELNIGKYIYKELTRLNYIEDWRVPDNFVRMFDKSMLYLSKKVTDRQKLSEQYGRIQRTRYSKRKKYELLRYFGRHSENSDSDRLSENSMDQVKTGILIAHPEIRELKTFILPAILEFATVDENSKNKNMHLFTHLKTKFPEWSKNEIFEYLLENKLLEPVWFNHDPKDLLNVYINSKK
ncbi:uncharacterized protein SCODWIG_02691 [Saccharomycodes ludwigii]|uniref:Uncharacterized protein n=1 Tax=Saccharomycodes ludwigii TaxID=36035 RepID=A0A376B9X9_9ASCO|nr:uncharacterized protein SCODWIG_02691 [Saccharomycodes ludwigii]